MKLFICFLTVLFLFLGGCRPKLAPTENSIVPNTPADTPLPKGGTEQTGENAVEYERKVITTADFAKAYDSIDVLWEDAALIIEGAVINTELFIHEAGDDAVPYTLFEVEAANKYKGSAAPGDIVLAAGFGGILTAEQARLDKKFPGMSDREKAERICISWGDTPIREGQTLLLFLSDTEGYQILDIDRPYYMLVGEFQGKFILDGQGFYVQDLPPSERGGRQPLIF